MKLLYFMDNGNAFGGAVNTLLLQAILMKKHGHDVIVCFSSTGLQGIINSYRKMCTENGILLFQLPYEISSCTENINVVSMLEDYDIIKNCIQQIKPDVIHSVQINYTVELVSRELSIPHIMNIYPSLPAFFSIQYIDVFPRYMLCDSYYWAKTWQNALGLKADCIRTVVDDFKFKESFSSYLVTRYISVGNVCDGKNQLEVIKAVHSLLLSGYEALLDIYGYESGSYALKCKNYVRDNNLDCNITFHGFCDNMKTVYKNSDVAIIGSVRESYPNVVSESLANSVIVVSTPVAGVPEVIKDSFNGYIADGYTNESIAKKLIQLEEDKKSGQIDKIIRNANETFLNVHSEPVIYEKLLEYYLFTLEDFKNNLNRKSIDIETVRKSFSELLEIFNENVNILENPQVIRRCLWYLYHVLPIIKELPSDASFYIWGAGKFGVYAKRLADIFLPFIKIDSYLDSYKDGSIEGIKIQKPDLVMQDTKSVVFIASMNGQWDIIDYLEKNGKICNKDYFFLCPRSW